MRLAFFSPLNPIQSGISDYSEELLPWLAPWVDIDLFVDGYVPSSSGLESFAAHDARLFASLAGRYDAIIYQMGNSPAHAYIYRALLRYAGIVVLHEHVLHHLISWMSWDHGDARTYLNEFRYCYGAEGEARARRIILGQENANFFDYPLSDRAINAAKGVIVHSEFVRRVVERVRPAAPVRVVPMGIPLPQPASETRSAARRRLGLDGDTLVLGSFGHINPFKRLDAALRAFRELRREERNAVYVLAGSVSPNYDVKNTVRMLGLDDSVRLVGYAGPQEFRDYVAATDVCINLRYPTAGETSASVLRLMGAGLPVLVSRSGTFEELPDGACVKVDVDDCEADLILEYLRLLAGDAELRGRIGENARRFVAQNHTLEQEAQGYVDALQAWYPAKAPLQPREAAVTLPIEAGVSARNAAAQPAVPGSTEEPNSGARSLAIPHPDSEVLDLIAAAATELGIDDDATGLTDAVQACADLQIGSGS